MSLTPLCHRECRSIMPITVIVARVVSFSSLTGSPAGTTRSARLNDLQRRPRDFFLWGDLLTKRATESFQDYMSPLWEGMPRKQPLPGIHLFGILGSRCLTGSALLDCHALKGFGIHMIGILDSLSGVWKPITGTHHVTSTCNLSSIA